MTKSHVTDNVVDLSEVRKRLHHKLEAAVQEAADRVAFELIMNLFGRYEALGVEPPPFEFIRMKEEWATIIVAKMEIAI